MFEPPVPGVPASTWRMNTALIVLPPVVPEIQTSAKPGHGNLAEHLPPLQPLAQLTTGTTTARASSKVCEDHVPLGSEASPAATRSLMPFVTAPLFTPGSAVSKSPTLTVQEHPGARFCLECGGTVLPLLELG